MGLRQRPKNKTNDRYLKTQSNPNAWKVAGAMSATYQHLAVKSRRCDPAVWPRATTRLQGGQRRGVEHLRAATHRHQRRLVPDQRRLQLPRERLARHVVHATPGSGPTREQSNIYSHRGTEGVQAGRWQTDAATTTHPTASGPHAMHDPIRSAPSNSIISRHNSVHEARHTSWRPSRRATNSSCASCCSYPANRG